MQNPGSAASEKTHTQRASDRVNTDLANHEPEEVRRWINAVCRVAGVKPTHLAKAASVSQSTVNRFLKKQSGSPRNLNGGTIYLLEDAARRLLAEAPETTVMRSNGGRERPDWVIRPVEVVGQVASSEWRDAVEWPDDSRYVISHGIETSFDGYSLIGFEVHGPDADLLYPIGSILVCVPFAEIDRGPGHDERVIVARRNRDDQIELTVREFRLDSAGGQWLWPRSTHPDHQAPIRVTPDIQIRALVVSSSHPEGVILPPKAPSFTS